MNTTHIAHRLQPEKEWEEQLPVAAMILLHLLPGALTMLLMLLVSLLLSRFGTYPGVPVLFVFVAPALILIQLVFLYSQGERLNGKYTLRGIVEIL